MGCEPAFQPKICPAAQPVRGSTDGSWKMTMLISIGKLDGGSKKKLQVCNGRRAQSSDLVGFRLQRVKEPFCMGATRRVTGMPGIV